MAETKIKKPTPTITAWVLLTIFIVIIGFTLVQSNYRQKQKNNFIVDMQSYILNTDRARSTKVIKLIQGKQHLDYLNDHQAILNFRLQPVPASGMTGAISTQDAWCQELTNQYYNSDTALAEAGYGGHIDPEWYQELMIKYMAASNCDLL